MSRFLKYLGYYIGLILWIPIVFVMDYNKSFCSELWYYKSLTIVSFISLMAATMIAMGLIIFTVIGYLSKDDK